MWAVAGERIREGDLVAFSGIYKRRTLWQWLTRQPRLPMVYVIRDAS